MMKYGKFVDEMAKCGKISAKFGEIWQGTSKIWRDLAEKCVILMESGGKQRHLAKFSEKGQNLAKYFKKLKNDKMLRNLRKIMKYGEICR